MSTMRVQFDAECLVPFDSAAQRWQMTPYEWIDSGSMKSCCHGCTKDCQHEYVAWPCQPFTIRITGICAPPFILRSRPQDRSGNIPGSPRIAFTHTHTHTTWRFLTYTTNVFLPSDFPSLIPIAIFPSLFTVFFSLPMCFKFCTVNPKYF